MFSVIIPLYNKAAYIEKAIRSVLNQTYQEFELIIVDDGSTDESLKIAKNVMSFLSPPLGGWGVTHQQNQGVSTARNNGVKAAKYDYIAFLDADDWWEPTYLEEMKQLILDFPQAGIYGSSYYKVKNGRFIPANIGVDAGFERGEINYFKAYSKTFWMPLTSISVVIKKTVFNSENGFKPMLKLGEDFDLWVRIAMKYSVVLLNKPLAYYNQDVTISDKAVVKGKIYSPETIYIFNLDYVWDQEQRNPDLKKLLDLLRVYTLERYRLQRAYPELVKKEIAKVDFSRQKISFWLVYHLPVGFINAGYFLRRLIAKRILKR